MARWLAIVPLVSVFSLASCAFLLDFDELSAGDGAGTDAGAGAGGTGGSAGSSGSSGNSGSGGSSGSSGSDAGGPCTGDCADTDPCTQDRCDTAASPPRCVHEPTKALVKDGVSETLLADEMHRVTMTSAGDFFYYSVFEQTNASPEVTLYRLGANAAASEELIKASSVLFLGQARSAGGLVVDPASGLLHAFTTLSNNVYHIVFPSDFVLRPADVKSVATTYDISNPRRHPVGMKLANGEIVGAWINNDGTVGIGSATRTAVALTTAPPRVSQIAPITSSDTPGVFWTGPNGLASGINVQLLGGSAVPLTACNTQIGGYLSATSVEVLPGFWLASWTKAAPGYLINEGKGIGCSGVTCASDPACGGSEQATPGLRNPALATAVRPGDPPGNVFLASATPILGPGADDASVTSAILLNVSRMVFTGSSLEATSEVIGSVELSRMAPIGMEYEGPDWPAVSILPPNKVSVAWLEPNPTGGDKLRLERYRICAP